MRFRTIVRSFAVGGAAFMLAAAPAFAADANPALTVKADGTYVVDENQLEYSYQGRRLTPGALTALQKQGKALGTVLSPVLAAEGIGMAFDSRDEQEEWVAARGGNKTLNAKPKGRVKAYVPTSRFKTTHSCAFTYTSAAARLYDGDSCTSGYLVAAYDTPMYSMPFGWNDRINSIKLHQYGTAPCGPEINIVLYNSINLVTTSWWAVYYASQGTSYNLLNAHKNGTSSVWSACG